jgi:hypothetical protein
LAPVINTARFLSAKIEPGENFNLATVYQDKSRYDRNAVDYRYFLEASYQVKVPGWDVLDYQQTDSLYLISQVGQIKPLETEIWEIELFEPEEVVEIWDLGGGTVIYKLK